MTILVLGLTLPGDARPVSKSLTREPAAAAGSPTIPPFSDPGLGGDYGIAFDPITPGVSKAKIEFVLPPVVLRGYTNNCIVLVGSVFPDPCTAGSTKGLPIDNSVDGQYWVVNQTQLWVLSSGGANASYGQFPAVKVHALAFGSIPVTAVVHLTQTVHKKYYDPLVLRLKLLGLAVPPGRPAFPGYGVAPAGEDPSYFQLPGSVSGSVSVRLSDITIDQKPLNVGPRCQTSRPATISLPFPGGFYPLINDPTTRRDKAGGFVPLNSDSNPDGTAAPAGWLDGTVDIPSFAGCRAGSEDLSPLLTSLVSGPGNPISSYSPHALTDWCSLKLTPCTDGVAAVQRAEQALTHAARAGESRARVAVLAQRLARLRSGVKPGELAGPTVGSKVSSGGR